MLEAIVAERGRLDVEAAKRGGISVHPTRLVHGLKDILSTDATLCLDMGSFHLWIARHLYSFRPRQVLITNGQQTLGVALPCAIAASVVTARIAPVMTRAFDTPGPVIVGVHVDYRENHLLFEMVRTDRTH